MNVSDLLILRCPIYILWDKALEGREGMLVDIQGSPAQSSGVLCHNKKEMEQEGQEASMDG